MAVEHLNRYGHSIALCLIKRVFYKNRRVVRSIGTALYCAEAKRYGDRLEHCVYRQYRHNRPIDLPQRVRHNHITVGNTWRFKHNLVYGFLQNTLLSRKSCVIGISVRADICNLYYDDKARYDIYDNHRAAICLVRIFDDGKLLYIDT